MMTASVDTSGLARAIPQILEFGRRTMTEQCVTSAAYICRDALELTTATPISRIDADMQAKYSPAILKSGKVSTAKRRQQEVATVPYRGRAEMIVLARMHPNSRFNQLTGGRWAIPKPNTKGFGAFWQFVRSVAERMAKSRRSSANYVRSGWKFPCRVLFASPHFRGKGRRGIDSSSLNPANTLQTKLGDAHVIEVGTTVTVIASNDVGENEGGSNAVLSRRHRQAVLDHALPAAQAAVEWEVRQIDAEIARRVEDGMPRINALLS